uniref:Uncharacterized protein n=1 Tax=Tetradesmus obliquus TaxID=3088 RepID=A0A383W174_TETOB|eukprot:jgi/Sobl393_1/4952/SZX70853.1
MCTMSPSISCSWKASISRQRVRALSAHGSSSAGRSTGRHAAAQASAAASATVLRKNRRAASGSNAEDSYDADEAAAAPMHALPGSRIEPDETYEAYEQSEEPLYGGSFDATHYDSQNWEQMTSLLSFDGEEHKYLMRHMPGAGTRVEDMFASFDGDDFEAVMTAAARSSEPAAAPAAKPAHNSSLDSSDEPEDLYLAVSRRRAAAMAAEAAANKQVPTPRRRKAPLGSQASDAWMFQAPANHPPAVLLQGLSLEQQYAAAQRALLPPLEHAAAATSGDASQQPATSVVAAAAAAAARQDAKQQQEVVVVVVQRPDAGDRPVSPAPHAAHAQPAGEPQLLPVPKLKLNISRGMSAAGLQSGAAAAGQARPAASVSEGMLGMAGVGAATVATQQRQPGEVWSYSSRVQSAAPVLLVPLAAATAAMAGAWGGAGQLGGVGGAAEAAAGGAEARTRLPALPSSDDEECEREMLAAKIVSGTSSSSKAGCGSWEPASGAGPVNDVVVEYNAMPLDGAVPARRANGTAALRRALCKLKGGVVASNRFGSRSSSSSS